MRYLLHLFTSPSAYLRNWRAYAINQAGHGAIGLVAAHFIGLWALAAYAAWEGGQLFFRRAVLSDCLEDWLFVAMGVCAVALGAWWVILFQAGWILHGALSRVGR